MFRWLAREVRALDEPIRLARMRRRLSGALFAERVVISRDTLNHLEKGVPRLLSARTRRRFGSLASSAILMRSHAMTSSGANCRIWHWVGK
jgi:hypothetical protein